MKRFVLLALGSSLLAAQAAAAPVVIHDHNNLALSASGDRVADVESLDPGNLAKEAHGSVVVRSADGKQIAQYDPCKDCKYTDIAWSPKAGVFAFIGRGTGKATLYVVESGKLRVLTTITGVANTIRFSPDSLRVAVLATVGAHKLTGATEAGAALTGDIGVSADEQRIGVVPLSGGALKLVSPADTYIYEYDWTRDGNFVATAAKGNGDNNWWVASLDFINAANATARVIAAPKMQMDLPRISPDGKTVAFVGGLMSDWRSIGGDIYTVPVAGGVPVDVTQGFKGTFRSVAWQGNALLASAIIDDKHAVLTLDPTTHAMRVLWSAPVSTRTQEVDGSVVFSADGKTAATISEDFTHANEIWLGRLPKLAPITQDNAALAQNVSAQSVHWANQAFHLQGWLIGPKTIAPGRKYPMVVIVHGGPSSAYTPRYIAGGGQHGTSFDFAYDLVAKGYYIFYPNDRGSYGEGEAFTRANIRDFGRGDMRDMLAGVDAVEKIAPVDDKRLGLYGHSYGGWFSMWANTQTRRFKAFVAGAGIANWTSYYGQNGIDQWMIPFFGGSVYDDPAVYRAASPIEFIKNAKTPTFIYVGERDVECPAPQSLEYWHALHDIGTPVSLHIYAGQGHHFSETGDLVDLRGRIIGWFDKYLK